jgi:two-component system, sensor histidine kinase and response regulator
MERILIVEDSATQREGLRHSLTQAGYEVVSASDGQDAWQRLAQLAPTMVVSDILMPRMDGYALCRAMKESAVFARVPVVLLTSLSDPKDVIAALECKADGFIGKPFTEDYLLSRIRGVIANRDLPQREKRERGIEISHEGRTYLVTAERSQILDLLLSVYEVAMRRNADLAQAQAKLRTLNSELEQKVRDRTRKLEEINNALETFCYSVAHDLRAPLRGIQGYVAMLKDEYASSLDDVARNYAERACLAAGRMDKMILDLLAYGRVSHADAPMEKVDLRAHIESALSEFSADIQAKGAEVSVRMEDMQITTSRILLAQILSNLIGNALKFVQPGKKPRVEIEATRSGDHVAICVRDQGIGIDPAYVEKIFNVFEKLHTEPFPGTGIGLAIVRKAVERLGGKIAVESQPGQGARFIVELPTAP